MGQQVEFRLNTSAKDARWMRGQALSETVKIDPASIRHAVEASMQPGLMALRQNVSAAKVKTGRLRRSPGILTRKYGGSKRLIIVGLVGYMAGVAEHSRYLEMGTPPRAGGRGQIAPRRYAWLAYFHTRKAMQESAQRQIEGIVERAIAKAT